MGRVFFLPSPDADPIPWGELCLTMSWAWPSIIRELARHESGTLPLPPNAPPPSPSGTG